MTKIQVYVKQGRVFHKEMHWRELIALLMDVEGFRGEETEFYFIDLDYFKLFLKGQKYFFLNFYLSK